MLLLGVVVGEEEVHVMVVVVVPAAAGTKAGVTSVTS